MEQIQQQEAMLEEIKALYFNTAELKAAPFPIYKYESGSDRHYYFFDQDQKLHIMPSVTTVISRAVGMDIGLVKWYAEKGFEAANEYKEERAYYGTFMHGLFAKFLIEKEIDLDLTRERINQYIEINKLPLSFADYTDDVNRNILALAQWVIDYNVRPLAIEIPLASIEMGIAGMIDLPCKIDIKVDGISETETYASGPRKGQLKEVKVTKTIECIVDFKSGKNFFESHQVQLELYRRMFNENFGTNIERVYNWAPSEWRGLKPTYKFVEQTTKRDGTAKRGNQKADLLLELGKMNVKQSPVTNITGLLKIGKEPWTCIETMSMEKKIYDMHNVPFPESDEINPSVAETEEE